MKKKSLWQYRAMRLRHLLLPHHAVLPYIFHASDLYTADCIHLDTYPGMVSKKLRRRG